MHKAYLLLVLGSSLLLGASVEQKGNYELEHAFKGARPVWPIRGFTNLPGVWADQVSKESPDAELERKRLLEIRADSEAFKTEVQKRYGLFYEPSLENDSLPLGMTRTTAAFSTDFLGNFAAAEPGIVLNCRACHTSTLFDTRPNGKVYTDGISNVLFDFGRLSEDVMTAAKLPIGNLFLKNPSRNSIVNAADYFGRLLTYVRQPYPDFDLLLGFQVFYSRFRLPQHRHLENEVQAYIKTQNWVNVGTKYHATGTKGLYVDGGFYDNPSTIMYGMAFTLDPKGKDFLAADQGFLARGLPYLESLKSPPYPYQQIVKGAAMDRGYKVFQETCAHCHGTYRKISARTFSLETYPGLIIPAEKVGTDPYRAHNPGFGAVFDGNSWIRKGRIQLTDGYKPPPLHGVWARAPYLHNGSVPNIRQLMKPQLRMQRFALQPRPNDPGNYDHVNLGWKVVALKSEEEVAQLRKSDPYVRIYDPDQYKVGLANTGHLYGADLTEGEIDDLIAFLKFL